MAKDLRINKNKYKPGPPPAADGGKVYPNVNPGGSVMRAPEQTAQDFIINQIVMRNVDRTPKDVGLWRTSHMAAESVYYPNRMRLYDLYADVILDGHLSGIIEKRINTTTNKTIRYLRAGKHDESFDELIESIAFNDMLKEALLAKFWGITGLEFLPGAAFAYKDIPRKHIKPEKGVIAINQTDYDGIPYEGLDNIWIIGKQRDLGLLLKAAFYVLLKKGTFSDWANFIEIFGQPMIITKYDTYDEKTKMQLTQMMERVGASLRLSLPKQADFEIVDGKTSNANGDLQDKFKNACNAELSVLILGNTETTVSSKSSGYAQSQTQSDEQDEITADDAKFVKALLNSTQFKTVLAGYGFDTATGKFVIEGEPNINKLKTKSEIDLSIKKAGIPIDDTYFYQTYNIPKPDNYEALKKEAQEQQAEANDIGDDEEGEEPTKPPKPKAEPAKPPQNLSAWYKIRLALADFFDPPR